MYITYICMRIGIMYRIDIQSNVNVNTITNFCTFISYMAIVLLLID